MTMMSKRTNHLTRATPLSFVVWMLFFMVCIEFHLNMTTFGKEEFIPPSATTQPSEMPQNENPTVVKSTFQIRDLIQINGPRPVGEPMKLTVPSMAKPVPPLHATTQPSLKKMTKSYPQTQLTTSPTAPECETNVAKQSEQKVIASAKANAIGPVLDESSLQIEDLFKPRSVPSTPSTATEAPVAVSSRFRVGQFTGNRLPAVLNNPAQYEMDLKAGDLNDPNGLQQTKTKDSAKSASSLPSTLTIQSFAPTTNDWRRTAPNVPQDVPTWQLLSLQSTLSVKPSPQVGAVGMLQYKNLRRPPVNVFSKPNTNELALTQIGVSVPVSLETWNTTRGRPLVEVPNRPTMHLPSLDVTLLHTGKLPDIRLVSVSNRVQLRDLDEDRSPERQQAIPDVLAQRMAELMGLVTTEPDIAITFVASLYDRWRSPVESEYIFDNVLAVGDKLGRGRGLEVTLTVIRRFMQQVQTEVLRNRVRMRIGRLYYEHGYFAKAAVELSVDSTSTDPDRYQSLAGLVKAVSLIRLRETKEAMVLLEWVARYSVDREQRARASMLLGRLELLYQRRIFARQWLELAASLTERPDQAAEVRKLLGTFH